MESTMSGNDLQNRCGLNDTQELRSPPEVDCRQPESPQGGPRHLGEACAPRTGTSARESGHRPAVACATAPRRPASRLRSGFGSRLRASAPVRARPCARASLCRSRCSSGGRGGTAGLGRSSPRGCQRPRRNSVCSSSPRAGATLFHRGLGSTTPSSRTEQQPGIPRFGPSPRSSGLWAAPPRCMRVTIPGRPTLLRTRVRRSGG